MQALPDIEGRRFVEIGGAKIVKTCFYCGKTFICSRGSHRIYCPNSNCRHEAQTKGMCGRRNRKRQKWTPEMVERWNEAMSTQCGMRKLLALQSNFSEIRKLLRGDGCEMS